jgi:hypothetical protein
VRRSVQRLLVLFLVVLSSIAGPAPCHGAPDADGERARDARALFQRAVERLNAGRFAEARDLFNQSLALAENPATVFNLSVAYRGTGESLRAAEVLRELIAGRYGSLEPGQRREAAALLSAVDAEIATLEVEVRGAPTAQIRIDGRHVGDANDGKPIARRADAGERVITVSAPDRITVERRVRVPRGKRARIAVVLSPTPEARVGRLVVVAANGTDVLVIDGVARARGKLERAVAPGRYRVRVISGERQREALVTVRARSTVRYEFDDGAERALWQSPVFWASAAGAVAVVTVAAVLLIGRPREDPVRDPEFGLVEALERR